MQTEAAAYKAAAAKLDNAFTDYVSVWCDWTGARDHRDEGLKLGDQAAAIADPISREWFIDEQVGTGRSEAEAYLVATAADFRIAQLAYEAAQALTVQKAAIYSRAA